MSDTSSCNCPECQPRLVVSSALLPTGPCRDCNCEEFIDGIDDPDFCLACNHHVAIHDREVNR